VIAVAGPRDQPPTHRRQTFSHLMPAPSAPTGVGTIDVGPVPCSAASFSHPHSLEGPTIRWWSAPWSSPASVLTAGYFSGTHSDNVPEMRLMDARFRMFPPLDPGPSLSPRFMGLASCTTESIAIASPPWPGLPGRAVAGPRLPLKRDCTSRASRSLGAGPLRHDRRHVLPNVASPAHASPQAAILLRLPCRRGPGLVHWRAGRGSRPTPSWGVMLPEATRSLLGDPWAHDHPGRHRPYRAGRSSGVDGLRRTPWAWRAQKVGP